MTAKQRFILATGILIGLGTPLPGQLGSDLLEKAPPHIDKALRDRVTFFYQAHVDGKFRLADTVVHEDSKDAFFVADKNQYKGFDIIKTNYNAEFNRASVVVAVKTEFMMPPAGRVPVTIPLTTFWKLEGGEWWWYVEPRSADQGVETPFGVMRSSSESDSDSPFDKLKTAPGVDAVRSQVRISKTDVKLNCASPDSDEIVVANGMPGAVKLQFSMDPVAGLTVSIDDPELKAGAQGKLHFSCEAAPDLAGQRLNGLLVVQPTNHQIPISIQIEAAPTAR